MNTNLNSPKFAALEGLKCPHHSPSSHFPLHVSDSLGVFLRRFRKWGCSDFFLLFSLPGLWAVMQRTALFLSCQCVPPPHCYVCFNFKVQLPHAAAERDGCWTSPMSVTRCLLWGCGDPVSLPKAPSKGSWPGELTGWVGFSLGKAVLTTGTLQLCLVTWGEKPHTCWWWGWSDCSDGGSLVSKQKLCFSGLCFEVAPMLWHPWSPGYLCSAKRLAWRKGHPSSSSWRAANRTSPLLRGSIVLWAGTAPS